MSQTIAVKKGVARLQYVLRLLTKPEFYDRLSDPFHSPSSLDGTLSTVCYVASLACELIRYKPQVFAFLKSYIRRIVTLLLRRLSPFLLSYKQRSRIEYGMRQWNTTVLPLSPGEERAATALRSLSSYISDIRIFNRMWSLPATISSGISGVSEIVHADDISRATKLLDLFVLTLDVVGSPLENMAFAHGHGWTSSEKESASKLSSLYYRIGSSMWMTNLVIAVLRTLVKMNRFRKAGEPVFQNYDLDVTLFRSTLNVPLSYHWATKNGCLNKFTVAVLALLAGLPKSSRIWKRAVENATRV